jgi:glycosyltransferase involved in cell wall biosynthesis
VVLAHDYLLVMRGAERTFAALADLYTNAPIYTLLYDEHKTEGRFEGRSVTASPLQRLGVQQSGFRRLLPLYPLAVPHLHPPACDLLLTSSSAFAHGIRAPEGAVHVCYSHTPFRYAWHEQSEAIAEVSRPLRPMLRGALGAIRKWDVAASGRVDVYLANSQLTRKRIRQRYGREAAVVHPPVETHRFAPGQPGDTLLVVSEIVRHKRVHVALEAARAAGMRIQVVGDGPDRAALISAYPEAEFLGRVPDTDLSDLYSRARAVVVPGIEEFGITAVEAQASGRPVIAAGGGGALETVLNGRTGRFATLDDVASFSQAMRSIDTLDFNPALAVQNSERFSVAAFQQRILDQVDQALQAREVGGRVLEFVRPPAQAQPAAQAA